MPIRGRARGGLSDGVIGITKMLPDYPKTKEFIKKQQMRGLFSANSSAMGLFSDVPETPIHEGHRFGLIREDGSLDEMKWKKIAVSRTYNLDEIENWSEQQVREYYESLGAEMGIQKTKVTLETLDKAVREVGNEISSNGPPSAELILRTYEKIWIDFQDDGKHVPLAIACSESSKAAFEKAYEQLETDPDLARRFAKIIERKKEEWRERESSRKLVD